MYVLNTEYAKANLCRTICIIPTKQTGEKEQFVLLLLLSLVAAWNYHVTSTRIRILSVGTTANTVVLALLLFRPTVDSMCANSAHKAGQSRCESSAHTHSPVNGRQQKKRILEWIVTIIKYEYLSTFTFRTSQRVSCWPVFARASLINLRLGCLPVCYWVAAQSGPAAQRQQCIRTQPPAASGCCPSIANILPLEEDSPVEAESSW